MRTLSDLAVNYDPCGFLFFQAEDGIRDVAVTGVQTCALPISGLGACMWSVSSLPSTRRDRAVTRKSKYLNFDRRHRMRRLSTFSLNSSVFELACAARVLGNNVAIAEKLVFIGRQSFKAHWTAGMKLTCADT